MAACQNADSTDAEAANQQPGATEDGAVVAVGANKRLSQKVPDMVKEFMTKAASAPKEPKKKKPGGRKHPRRNHA